MIDELVKDLPIARGGIEMETRFKIIEKIIDDFPEEHILKSNAVWYYIKL